MFKKMLIANRGEIALRVIRACREMGIPTVAIHSTADAESLHVRFADEAICVGPPAAKESYLNIPAVLSAAEVVGADSVHPGYGFLSENPDFAEVCAKCGLHFIGPRADAIRKMGNKIKAREAMAEAGLPLLPGSEGALVSEEDAARVAERIGFPILLKAAAGGGGRGMKVVRDLASLGGAFHAASSEAIAAFGSGELFLERYVDKPRHIEVQIVADNHGNVVHLGERECSVQRRHQKLVEESPSPALDEARRAQLCDAAVSAIRKVGYNSLGTMEFLFDEHGDFFFLEMNTRIQVEHPVTEAVMGVDLVKEQIRLAAGETLTLSQHGLRPRGHAIECRINAEDPNNFAPSPGLITAFHAPGGLGVRVDSAAYEQYRVLPYYDSLVAKLIVHAEDRDTAIRRMRSALAEFVVEGIRTSIPFQQRVMASDDFVSGRYDTRLVERILGAEGKVRGPVGRRAHVSAS
jgi:acetyl-CoA carboxylase, biotin carboxylase subunit